ncbi:hypothetical protein [Paenilisteria newyorkensis]|uniref:hypothetical protein n=1 Tax=Listeria newyorkensis TaxID=1497681 RepID=UPI002359235C|nr:hypothetical protein [Listeria newyorkensis]WAO22072.1 hypothetical protein OTR81_01910 [Listeria newyorkensis]
MARPVKNKKLTSPVVYGVWTLAKFADASPRSYSWWIDNIYDYPEISEFSNWNDKKEKEHWAFDAVKANEWLIKKFVYKEV